MAGDCAVSKQVITLLTKMERLRSCRMHRNIHSTLERMLEVIKRVQASRGEEIVNAQIRARAGNPTSTEDLGEEACPLATQQVL